MSKNFMGMPVKYSRQRELAEQRQDDGMKPFLKTTTSISGGQGVHGCH